MNLLVILRFVSVLGTNLFMASVSLILPLKVGVEGLSLLRTALPKCRSLSLSSTVSVSVCHAMPATPT